MSSIYDNTIHSLRRARVELHVGAMLTIHGLPDSVEDAVKCANTFTNPEFVRKERLGLWTGATDEWIQLYHYTPEGHLTVPRGTLPLVVGLCRERGIKYDITDGTVCPPLDVTLAPGRLFDYQERGLTDLLKRETGLLEAPTGSGKTNIALSVIPRVTTPTLILTHTGELFRQTLVRVRDWLGVEAGALGAGKWELRPITVAMIQTLARRDLRTIAAYFGCVLIDECHHAPAWTWAGILNQLPARYRYGFTATAWRKDGLHPLMFRTIGNITAKISVSEVRCAGKIVAPTIETVRTEFYFDLEDTTKWPRMITALVQDEARNALIVDEVRDRLQAQTRALILSDRVEHVTTLAALLEDLRPVILTGVLTKSERDAAMRAVRAGAQLTIATSSLLGEGVDVPGWDLLFLATPMAGGPRTLQAIGRVSRAAPGKDRAVVIDFVDVNVLALANAHDQRVRLYDTVVAARCA
jgi:superfamily II DNA or RNA helicase